MKKELADKFTFQYVSILICRTLYNIIKIHVFTFQYVSILIYFFAIVPNLFNIIYIPICLYFNHQLAILNLDITQFTFQYVSILIGELKAVKPVGCKFTFQYVSILIVNKSTSPLIIPNLHSNMSLF